MVFVDEDDSIVLALKDLEDESLLFDVVLSDQVGSNLAHCLYVEARVQWDKEQDLHEKRIQKL